MTSLTYKEFSDKVKEANAQQDGTFASYKACLRTLFELRNQLSEQDRALLIVFEHLAGLCSCSLMPAALSMQTSCFPQISLGYADPDEIELINQLVRLTVAIDEKIHVTLDETEYPIKVTLAIVYAKEIIAGILTDCPVNLNEMYSRVEDPEVGDVASMIANSYLSFIDKLGR